MGEADDDAAIEPEPVEGADPFGPDGYVANPFAEGATRTMADVSRFCVKLASVVAAILLAGSALIECLRYYGIAGM